MARRRQAGARAPGGGSGRRWTTCCWYTCAAPCRGAPDQSRSPRRAPPPADRRKSKMSARGNRADVARPQRTGSGTAQVRQSPPWLDDRTRALRASRLRTRAAHLGSSCPPQRRPVKGRTIWAAEKEAASCSGLDLLKDTHTHTSRVFSCQPLLLRRQRSARFGPLTWTPFPSMPLQ